MEDIAGLPLGMGRITAEEIEQCENMFDQELFKDKKVLDSKSGWQYLTSCNYSGYCDIYRRPLEGTGLYEYYAIGEFHNLKPEVMFCMNMDSEYRTKWDQYALKVSTVEIYENGMECIHWQCKFPWPLTNRDYVFYRAANYNSQKNVFTLVSKGGKHDAKPVDKNFVRVDTYYQRMCMRQKPNTDEPITEFRMQYHDDMKGNIPKAIVNWAVGTGLPQFVKQMYQTCQNYPKDRLQTLCKKFNIPIKE